MPNWCTTQYILVSDCKEQMDRLHSVMQEFESEKRKSLCNGFGTTWLGNLVEGLGASWEDVYCRGEWSGLEYGRTPDGSLRLSFETQHAWSRPYEVEELIRQRFPDIDIYFFEEEPGMCIFQTNDEDGVFFPEQYLVDIWDDSYEYYTLEGAMDKLSDYFGQEFSTIEEAQECVRRYNEKAKAEDSDAFINFVKADIVSY